MLHLIVVAAFIIHADHSAGPQDTDTTLPLSLTMFEEAKPEQIALEPEPKQEREQPPDKETTNTADVQKPKIQPALKPAITAKPVAEPIVVPEPSTQLEATLASEPVIEARSPRQHAQQESLKQRYIRTLLKRIHRKKHYPHQARRNREHGEVLVSFIISKTGEISQVQIRHSSGYANLDKAALRTISRISPLEPIPNELDIMNWELAVPIAFNLRKY